MALFDESPAERRRGDARQEVENGAWRITQQERERAGVTDRQEWSEVRQIYPGSTTTQRYLRPQYGLRAARDILAAAREQMDRQLAAARGAGLGWEQIGEHLGLGKAASAAGMSVGRAAWRLAAMRVFPNEPDRVGPYAQTYGVSARWTCGTCRRHITEGDVEFGVSEQKGHGDGCAMLARERAAEQAAWDAVDD